MTSEMTNVASETKSPMILIVFAAERGNKASRNAAAMGSQIVLERMCVMASPAVSLSSARAPLAPRSGERVAEGRVRGSSREDPYEYDHSHKKHQRVVAHVARLQEAQQIARRGDDVAAESENAIDHRIDAAPQES